MHIPNNMLCGSKSVALKEETAYPANSEDGYDGKNFLVKECANIFMKILI